MSTVRTLISVNAILGVSLAIGFLNNVAISGFFGLNRFVDAYFASSILGSMFMYLIVDYLGRNFLPVYSARFRESPQDASRVASTVITLMALVAAGTVSVMLMFSEPIFAFLLPGFERGEIGIVTKMFAIQAPSIVLMTVNNFHQFIWQHDEHYNRVVFARLFLPLTILLFVIGGYLVGNVYSLAMGFVAGHLVSGVVLAYKVPYRYRPSLDLSNPDVKRILANSALLTGSGLITKLRGPIQQYFASQLGEGAIAGMSIAYKMCKPIYESSLMGIRMIVFSKSSRQAASGNFSKLAGMYDYALSAVLLALVPIAVWMILNAEPLVTAIFLRGEFTHDMAVLVSLALFGAAGGIVFQGIQQILSNAFYALQKISVPLVVMPISTIIFFVATKYLTEGYGIFGLTLAAAIVAALVSAVFMVTLAAILNEFSAAKVFWRLMIYTVPALAAGIVGTWIADSYELTGVRLLLVTAPVTFGLYALMLGAARESILTRIFASLRSAILVSKPT